MYIQLNFQSFIESERNFVCNHVYVRVCVYIWECVLSLKKKKFSYQFYAMAKSLFTTQFIFHKTSFFYFFNHEFYQPQNHLFRLDLAQAPS